MEKPELGTDIGMVVAVAAIVLSVATPLITSIVTGKATAHKLSRLEEDLLNSRLEAVAAKGRSEAFEEGLAKLEKQQDIMHVEQKQFQAEQRQAAIDLQKQISRILERIPQLAK